MKHSLLQEIEIVRVENRNAGTPGTVKGDIIDMLGWDGVLFLVQFQTVVNDAVVTLKVAQGDTNDTADMAASVATTGAITSDGTTIALSNKTLAVEVVNPLERYLEAQVVIADQNAPIDTITAIKFRGGVRPSVQPSGVYFSDTFVSPAAA